MIMWISLYSKAELYGFIYIIFHKHLSDLQWIILMFLDPECIVNQEDFQHKILNWSNLLPLLSLQTSGGAK